MAKITMPLDRRVRLPRACMVCGTNDCDFERVTIRPSVGAGGMVALANREGYSTLTLSLPLCHRHRNHFAFQTVLRFLGIAATVAVSLFGLVLLAAVGKGWVIGVIVAAVLAVVAAWFVISMNANKSRVHVSGYTGDTAVFSNVSPRFARVYEQQWGDGDEDRAPRQPPRPIRRQEPEVGNGDFDFT